MLVRLRARVCSSLCTLELVIVKRAVHFFELFSVKRARRTSVALNLKKTHQSYPGGHIWLSIFQGEETSPRVGVHVSVVEDVKNIL
jgi:hypothetical protein